MAKPATKNTETQNVTTSTQTVTVGCKLPHGLVLEVGSTSVTLNGANASNIIGGYGLTEGVDKAFFDAWLKKNEHLPFVRNQMVFAQSTTDDAKAEALEKAHEKTGFEGMNDADMPAGVSKVEEK